MVTIFIRLLHSRRGYPSSYLWQKWWPIDGFLWKWGRQTTMAISYRKRTTQWLASYFHQSGTVMTHEILGSTVPPRIGRQPCPGRSRTTWWRDPHPGGRVAAKNCGASTNKTPRNVNRFPQYKTWINLASFDEVLACRRDFLGATWPIWPENELSSHYLLLAIYHISVHRRI